MYNQKYPDAVSLAQRLIQFDTTNGVSPERDCILYIKELLDSAGIETKLVAREDSRPNLMGVLRSTCRNENIPPLLLYGHVDVVPTDDQQWKKDPFGGIIEDGYLWGRGAIDMKGQHGMFLEALLRLAAEEKSLPYDIYYLAVSDEEGTSDYGMKYLVENHPELFDGLTYAIGEIGGFSIEIAGKKLYPIQIAEKQVADIKIIAKGEGGHASMSHTDTAMERLAGAITKLCRNKLPVRITEPARLMINAIGESLGGVQGMAVKQLLKPSLTDKLLGVMGSAGALFDPLLHNSLNVTVVGGGDAINVIPSKVWCRCDLRLVPQCSLEDAIADIKKVIGNDFDIEVLNFDYGAKDTNMDLYESMAKAIKKADPDAYPVPFVLAGVTDARFLVRAGVQSYGFTPMKLPKDYDFTSLAHNADERVPVEALRFGAEVIYEYIVKDYEECFYGK